MGFIMRLFNAIGLKTSAPAKLAYGKKESDNLWDFHYHKLGYIMIQPLDYVL